jgi:hypothetical protein
LVGRACSCLLILTCCTLCVVSVLSNELPVIPAPIHNRFCLRIPPSSSSHHPRSSWSWRASALVGAVEGELKRPPRAAPRSNLPIGGTIRGRCS